MIAWRDAGVADAAALAKLAARTFEETFGHLYPPADLAAFLATHTPEGWAAELADPAYAVRIGEAGGKPAGYVKLGPPAFPIERPLPAVELRQFYLLGAHQGTGAAAEAMEWTIAESRRRGAGHLFLSVYVGNARAHRFYARYGFERVGRYGFMVGAVEDEDDIMRLTL